MEGKKSPVPPKPIQNQPPYRTNIYKLRDTFRQIYICIYVYIDIYIAGENQVEGDMVLSRKNPKYNFF